MNDTAPSAENKSRIGSWLLGFALVAFVAGLRLLPSELRPFAMMPPIGALALYAGGRLGSRWGLVLPLGLMALTDAFLYLTRGWQASPMVYVTTVVWFALGRGLLTRTESLFRIGGTALLGTVIFFLLTNAESWMLQALPEYRDESLLYAYQKGLEFLRPSMAVTDIVCAIAFFGLHRVVVASVAPVTSPIGEQL